MPKPAARARAGPRTTASRRSSARRFEELDFHELFENANDIVILNDRRGCIVMANRAAREFGGYSLEEVERGVDLREVMPADEYEAAMILTERALDGLSIPEVYERHAVLRDGRRRILELRSSVLRRRNGEPLLQTIGRDVTESRQAAAFQASLAEVARALLSAQRPQEVGALICQEALRVLEVDGVYLFLRSGDEIIGIAGAGELSNRFVGIRRSLGTSFIGEIYQRTEPFIVHDFAAQFPDLRLAPGVDIRALMAVPLRGSGENVGVLSFIHCRDARFFAGAVCDRALIFAAQTAVAIESALTREREQEEGRVSAALLHVARAIRESLEEREVVAQIVKSARAVLDCDWTFVSLWDVERDVFRVVATNGFTPAVDAEVRTVEFRLKDFPETASLHHGGAVEYAEPPPFAAPLFERWGATSMLSYPMIRGGVMIGTFVAGYRQRRGRFSNREHRIVEGVASQAAIAVDNARLVEDLRHANEMKSEFLGTMSHELRTPLAAIIGYADLMRDGVMGSLQEQQDLALERMLINGRALLDLINTTLDVNRLESGRAAVGLSRFTLDELIGEIRTEVNARPPDGAVDVVWPLIPAVVLHSDRGKLKVALRNLIDNALKFTPSGSVTIAVSCDQKAERVKLSVADTGIGIPAEHQAAIFEMFRQVDATHDYSRTGVGLGLYLVRRYARLLGGDVRVESIPGEGSTFILDLPTTLS